MKVIIKLLCVLFIIFICFSCQREQKLKEEKVIFDSTEKVSKVENEEKRELLGTHVVIDDSVIDQNDVFRIIEPLWWSVSIYDGMGKYLLDLSNYSKQQKYIWAIKWYDGEVNNGGHYQFYSNSTGIVWKDAMDGFKEIGFTEAYEIILESTKRFGLPPSRSRDIRNEQMEDINLDFDDLDSRYYKLDDLESRLLSYIRENREHFYFEGLINRPKGFYD